MQLYQAPLPCGARGCAHDAARAGIGRWRPGWGAWRNPPKRPCRWSAIQACRAAGTAYPAHSGRCRAHARRADSWCRAACRHSRRNRARARAAGRSSPPEASSAAMAGATGWRLRPARRSLHGRGRRRSGFVISWYIQIQKILSLIFKIHSLVSRQVYNKYY